MSNRENSTRSEVSDYLRIHWEKLTKDFPEEKNQCFNELIDLYNSSGRYYHNLHHIEALLKLSEKYREMLKSPETIDLAIWYHDAIYDSSKSNNEEKSAELAKNHLSKLGIDSGQIEEIFNLIVATKSHQLSDELSSFDAQFLLDIDLSILAAEKDVYLEYTKQIRNEYKIYPNFLYKKGRKKVLKHFLEMDHIYKTDLFQNLWEKKAKENITIELSAL